MKIQHLYICVLLILGLSSCSLSDNERKMVREGNKAYQDSIFDEAEVLYRKALDYNPTSFSANYNIANTTYKQKNYKSAVKKYKRLLDSLETKEWKASANHNLGNSYLHTKELDKSIEAYKEALRNNPDDVETKYNLVYAMNMREQQKQQQKKQQQQNKDNKQDQKNKDQQNKDKQNQQDKKDKDKQDKQNQEQKKDQKSKQGNKPKDGDKEKKPQPKPQKGDDEDKKDDKQDKENKSDQQKGDKKDENKDKKGDNKKDEDKQGDKDKQNPQQQPQQGKQDQNGEKKKVPVGISKQDAENILNAIAAEEKESQKKVQKDKARKAGVVRKKKNW